MELMGQSLPVLNASANAQGTYSIDPNGDGSYHSGLVSKTMLDLSENIRFTIDTYIESAASWSELEFGLVNTNNIPTNPNTSSYTVAKVMLDADTQNTGYKLYASFVGDGGSQTISQNESATAYFNAWHSFSFEFAADGSASIAIDDQTIFSSDAGIFNYSTEAQFAIMLAGRSYSTSDNLYDNVDLTQVPEFFALCGHIGLNGCCCCHAAPQEIRIRSCKTIIPEVRLHASAPNWDLSTPPVAGVRAGCRYRYRPQRAPHQSPVQY